MTFASGYAGKLIGKVALITGCSSGIGIETARANKSTGATVYLTVRDVARGQKALADILEEGKVEMLTCDQNSLASVEAAAKDFLSCQKLYAQEIGLGYDVNNYGWTKRVPALLPWPLQPTSFRELQALNATVWIDLRTVVSSLVIWPPSPEQPEAIQFNPSVAEDDKQPSLVKLGRDILIIIFDFIQETSPRSLQAIALVSSEFYHLAEHSRYRRLTLNLGPSAIEACQGRLRHIEKQKLLSAIRFLEVNEPGENSFKHRQQYLVGNSNCENADQYHDCINSISNSILSMTGLKDISWNDNYGAESIPNTVLKALRSCPKVRLHAKVSARSRQESNLDKLQGNANLSKLKVDILFEGAEDCQEATQPLKRILLSSPHIRSLSLTIRQPDSGCTVYEAPSEYCGFGFVADELMPPLEELVVSDYPWGYESEVAPGEPLIQGLYQTGYPGKGSEMDYWAENFDWSRLRRLQTRFVDFALRIMPKLTSLKEVEFTGSRSQESIIRFYQQCPAALEVIGAESLQSITLEGVLRHGSVLRKLGLHTVEDWNGKWAKGAVDAASLRIIRDGCPLIEELFVDIARNGDWPWEILDVLASFPRLRHLAICFEVGVKNDDDPVKPYVTFTSADTLYTYLRSHSPRQPSILSRLQIYSGAPPPIGYGLPTERGFWPEYNSTEFICTLSERDEEAAKGVFEVVCPKLPKEVQLRKNDHAFKKNMRKRTKDESCKVAYEGPTPVSEWHAHF